MNQKNSQLQTAGAILSREERISLASQFNLLSNVFMSVALDDVAACEHVIRILTGIKDLVVKEIRTQYRLSKITSHDAILDILAEDNDGKLYNLEIQRKDTLDHARRTRFYGAMIDSEYLEKGKDYDALPDVYVIYISETDLWKAGYTTYPVNKVFENTDVAYEDGMHVLYVNAAVDDGSETAKLMQYFKTADPDDMGQGALSRRIHFLKKEEGGHEIMCEISDRIYQSGMLEGKIEGKIEGKREGIIESKREVAHNLLSMGLPVSQIAKALSIPEDTVKVWLKQN